MQKNELERELRRNLDTLSSVGLGVMAFGVWSVIQAVVLFILEVPEQLREISNPEYVPIVLAIAIVALVLLVAAILLLRVYIGLSARREWLPGKHRRGYLVAAGFLAALNLVLLLASLTKLLPVPSSVSDVATVVVQFTSVVTLFQMIAAARRVRQLRQQLEERQG